MKQTLYGGVRAEVLADDEEDERATLESLDRYFEEMRQRRAESTALVAEFDRADEDDGGSRGGEKVNATSANPAEREAQRRGRAPWRCSSSVTQPSLLRSAASKRLPS